MIYRFKKLIKKFTPAFLFDIYHYFLAFFFALICGFPSRKIKVVAVTGTKGKTTVVEIINAILEKAGFKTALVSSLRFKIGEKSFKNTLKMTMPGRGKIQRFIKQAAAQKCDWLILEATSEGIKQFRHKFIDFDALIFTNLSPEHIESHGSFEKYKEAKGKLFKEKGRKGKMHIINLDDENAEYFLSFKADEKFGYGIKQIANRKSQIANFDTANPSDLGTGRANYQLPITNYQLQEDGIDFEIGGQNFHSPLFGEFNLYNILSGIAFARTLNIDPFDFALFESEPQSRGQGQSRACRGIDWEIIKEAVAEFKGIKGRMQFINEGQPFKVVIDYAHTPDSLLKVYETLLGKTTDYRLQTTVKNKEAVVRSPLTVDRLICVLGAAGGGRDKWKRPEMGKIAAKYCDEIILTNEDPYDEQPEAIINEIASGCSQIRNSKPRSRTFGSQRGRSEIRKILNRKEAIKKAVESAKAGDAVVVTGKGSESWITEKNAKKIPWDEEAIVRECLRNGT